MVHGPQLLARITDLPTITRVGDAWLCLAIFELPLMA
jgi:hypothetical protein